MAEEQNASAAWPVADAALLVYPQVMKGNQKLMISSTQEILDIVQQASHYRQLKKGANEA